MAAPTLGFGTCRPVETFEKKNRIGEGTYGTVYRAIDRETGEVVALKKIILHNEQQVGFPITSLREARVLRRLSHPNCVGLRDVAVGTQRDCVFLVFEYCEHDMSTLMQYTTKKFSESEVKGLMVQLLRAIEYIHSLWIVHRDLKMSNLLYNSKGLLKLADFGLAREYGHPVPLMTPKVVTLWYRAPELLLGTDTYGPAVDMWAAGCIFGEFCERQPLMPGSTDLEQIRLIFKFLGTPNEDTWPGVSRLPMVAKGAVSLRQDFASVDVRNLLSSYSRDTSFFLSSLLIFDPSSRPSAEEALSDAYFKSRPLPQKPEFMPTFPSRHELEEGPAPKRQRA